MNPNGSESFTFHGSISQEMRLDGQTSRHNDRPKTPDTFHAISAVDFHRVSLCKCMSANNCLFFTATCLLVLSQETKDARCLVNGFRCVKCLDQPLMQHITH